MDRTYTIGQLAAEVGVNVETIRYYHRRKLLHEPMRPAGSTRRYTSTDAARLRFIKSAQRMGFSLTEIEGLLTLLSQTSCRKTRAAAATKLELIDERVRELQNLRNELAHLLTECDANDDDLRCPIIERFGQQGYGVNA